MSYKKWSVPTLYKEIEFKSRLEARWAIFFDALGLKWRYEPVTAALGIKWHEWTDRGEYQAGFMPNNYTPDFYLYDLDIWIEVKPLYPDSNDLELLAHFISFKQEYWFETITFIPPAKIEFPAYVENLADWLKPPKRNAPLSLYERGIKVRREYLTENNNLLLVYGSFYKDIPKVELWRRENNGISITRSEIDFFGNNLQRAIEKAAYHKF